MMKGEIHSTKSPVDVKSSKAWSLLVMGYSVGTVALVVFLTINGASGIPTMAMIITAVLVAIGLFLPAAGMLRLRRIVDPAQRAARNGFAMQALGLIGLFFGVALVVAVSSLSGYFASAVIVVTMGALALLGGVFLTRHHTSFGASSARVVVCLVLGMALLFLGTGLIAGSNIAYQYVISQVENTIYVDIGATVSACGCVIAAYSSFVLRNH
jgi:uncharacterized membrane protein YidH (DUF202 family)